MSNDKRVTERLERYWKLICGNDNIPKIQKFNSAAVEDIWPQCFTVSVHARSGIHYKYEYMGEAVVKAYGQDLTHLAVNPKMKEFPGSIVIKKLDKVIVRHKPCEDEGHLLNKNGQIIKYRACFLPFGTEKKGLTHIVAGLSFRVF